MSVEYFITGGAGFIGSNYVNRLLQRKAKVTIYDNLSRAGAPLNIKWLKETHGDNAFQLVAGDVRDADLLAEKARQADVIVHLAAQVAVTTSVLQPREDFEINAQGTFNVIEAARSSGRDPVVLFASTNKVYGEMEDVPAVEASTRWRYENLPLGCPETQPLDFHSPYGCSKGAGDQYVRDYSRIYGLRSVVFRQSCIYGPRQFGVEDQGWLAWMVIAAITGRKISIYGDGKQVRDVLHVDDLLDAYDAVIANIEKVKGRVYNLGGGSNNVISVWAEFGPMLEKLLGKPIPVTHGDWRPGDQKVFVADIRKAESELGWKPKINVEEGVKRLFNWVLENRHLF
ncbi:MAG: CDP-paratose 2-epimerase [Chloroflexi bacterium GWB2_49_20]|nr:MAG: CDP-paratose 2-epimerase [Chloroflexi bacterium GWB2_49_20]OGN79872.1 MAG: CDP-paratose 2-epimerase [Chloroflexi bacterium GWC2_49_37]OGN85593.1 MAG: CDP-paratose 2-epimerase [Chloroflexi bacterium GWD2_49_16]HBG74471.1 CDP-paratose 2-epimerase [Anaerolineae bacterium]HCC79656.1 CDP-paratose 2-epimerase [Anaerolineae bacterium]